MIALRSPDGDRRSEIALASPRVGAGDACKAIGCAAADVTVSVLCGATS